MLDEHGRPVAKARVEIWQCDANGRYRHPGDRGGAPQDPNFQGYGELTTAADGAYRFRTIRPAFPTPMRAAAWWCRSRAIPTLRSGELVARFDIVLAAT